MIFPSPSSRSAARTGSLFGVGLVMFLCFVGFSASQFYGYLFQCMGFSPLEIGLLLGLGFTAGIVAPWAQTHAIRLLRSSRRPLLIMLGASAAAMIALPHALGFAAVAAVFFLCIFGVTSVPPLNIACTLDVTRQRGDWIFFLIRGLGTAGFLLGCLIGLLDPRPEFLPRLYTVFGSVFLMALGVAAWNYPADTARSTSAEALPIPPRKRPDFRRALRLLSAPKPRRLLITIAVMGFANSMATLMQGNYLVDRFQGGQASISRAWIISTSCEIPWMVLCAWLARRASLRAVIGLGLFGTALKLVLIGVAETRWMYYLGLISHGCFFSGALTGFNLYLDRRFPATDRPTLQAAGLLFYQGLPSACGGLAAGLIWHAWGLRAVYGISAGIGALTAIYTFFLLPQLPGRGRI